MEAFVVHCPECETDLDIDEDEVDEGEIVSCPECGSDFEIITVSPIELKPVDEEKYEEDDEEEVGDGDLSEITNVSAAPLGVALRRCLANGDLAVHVCDTCPRSIRRCREQFFAGGKQARKTLCPDLRYSLGSR